jgi:Tfp pilus assembly protein PilF
VKAIIKDELAPLIVRATALSLLGRYPAAETMELFQVSLISDESIIRRTALMHMPPVPGENLQELVAPLLSDPVKSVRIEAARVLAVIPAEQMAKKWHPAYDSALAEYLQTALYSADFAISRLNLGALATVQGQLAVAEEHFKKAISIDRDLHAARTNLAVLYSRQGKQDLAEEALRQALAVNPELADVHFSLGLLLSEKRQYEAAVNHLQLAAAGLPGNARVYYNLGQLLVFLRRNPEAETALRQAFEIEPQNRNYQQAVAKFYIERGQLLQAQEVAEKIIAADKNDPFGRQLLEFIQKRSLGNE